MNTTWKRVCVLGSALSLLATMQAFSQETRPGQERSLIERAAGPQKVCLASKVAGMTVKDKANQAVGQIRDLVIDQTGQVQYLAIASQAGATERDAATPDQPRRTPGQPIRERENAAAAGAKLVLVPFEAAQFHEGESPAQNYVSLNIDKDKLMQAPSFTSQQLASQAQQAQWMSQVDKFFNRQAGGAARPDLKREQEEPKENREDK